MLRFRPFLDMLTMSKLSILGAVLVTTAVGADVMLIVGELLIFESNPYIGIVAYVIFPSVAALGLGLIPAGILLHERKRLRANQVREIVSRIRRMYILRLILILSMFNFVIFAFVGYRGFHYVESAEFCGLLCHQVMSPEYTAYKYSPHSEIHCVDCHVGSGPGWFLKSKLDGTRQLLGVITDNYARPIETPIHNLRPAKDVCQVCHSTESYQGSRIKVIERYLSNEANTRTYTVLNLLLGADGKAWTDPDRRGIHWHSSEDHEIRFFSTDHKRQNVVRVELTTKDGDMRVWTRPGTENAPIHPEPETMRIMDCVDCHNRPAHNFRPPDVALDESLAADKLDPAVPWIRKLSEELITTTYESSEEAMAAIAKLPEIYQQRFPNLWFIHAAQVRESVPVLQEIYSANVFPEMKIDWNTYPSHLGHPTAHSAGCFRCHDGGLVDQQGSVITNDCTACHYVLAEDEQDPVVLRMLEDR
ncbi:MAG: hypothetical protein ACI89L_002306 [Phycisphaerales bacterium]|jgi:hypothetical protein